MKKTRVAALILSMVMIAGCSACSSSSSSSTSNESGSSDTAEPVTEIRVGWLSSPDSLDPANSNNSIGLSLCYDSLFSYNGETGKIEPNLVDTYQYLDDTTLQLTLKKGVTFSNGEELKASDVLYSLRRVVDPETGSSFANSYSQYDLDNSYVVDDYTLVIKYTAPYGPGIGAMTAFNDIVSEKFFESTDAADLWDQTCGTGAYTCVENVSGSHTTYQLRDNYWDADNTPQVKTIVVTTYSEVSTMLVDFENGDLDVMVGLDDSTITRLEAGEVADATYKILPDFEQTYLLLPEYVAAFKDVRVRQAIATGVDWASIVDVAVGETGIPSTSVLAPTVTPYYKDEGAYEYDPDSARALLKEAGYNDGDIVLNVLAGNDPSEQRFYEALQGYLADIGITMNFECFDTNTIIGRQASGETDLFLMGGKGAVNYPEPYLALDKATANFPLKPCIVSDPEWLALYDNGLHTVDTDKRVEYYNKMQDWMKENCRWIPVYQQAGAICWNSKIISDIKTNTTTRLDLNNVTLVGS